MNMQNLKTRRKVIAADAVWLPFIYRVIQANLVTVGLAVSM